GNLQGKSISPRVRARVQSNAYTIQGLAAKFPARREQGILRGKQGISEQGNLFAASANERAGFFGPGPTSISARVRRRWRRTQDHVPDGSTPATWNPLGRHGRRAERPKPRSGRRQATAPGAGGKPHYFRWWRTAPTCA